MSLLTRNHPSDCPGGLLDRPVLQPDFLPQSPEGHAALRAPGKVCQPREPVYGPPTSGNQSVVQCHAHHRVFLVEDVWDWAPGADPSSVCLTVHLLCTGSSSSPLDHHELLVTLSENQFLWREKKRWGHF